jgi:hypothetical protein
MATGELYRPQNTSMAYSYDSSTQTLNFSGNWDFDGDGLMDSFFFVGNGGAHLYFHPKFVLSSNRKVWNLGWIELDFPLLSSIVELKGKDENHEMYPKIVIHDFDGDGIPDIYLNFDIKFCSIPLQWKKRGVSSHRILLKFKSKRLSITNYIK